MKVKAKKSFFKLGNENNFQGLDCEVFRALHRGEIVEIDGLNKFIEEHVEIIKTKKEEVKKDVILN
ncbi:MAG: hypothetical protein WC579_01610 [Candidatus Paceibacterota bacterium]|jgi:hypothetical protein